MCGGSGAELIYRAAALGAQALVTGETKHNLLLEARALGIMLVDAGHYCTEHVVLEPLAALLRAGFPALDVCISECESDPMFFA